MDTQQKKQTRGFTLSGVVAGLAVLAIVATRVRQPTPPPPPPRVKWWNNRPVWQVLVFCILLGVGATVGAFVLARDWDGSQWLKLVAAAIALVGGAIQVADLVTKKGELSSKWRGSAATLIFVGAGYVLGEILADGWPASWWPNGQ